MRWHGRSQDDFGWSLSLRAFTLVELLTVIGIIAVLMAILLPALSRAKQASQSAVCVSNLRQWGLGLAMYVSDFSEFPPLALIEDPPASGYNPRRYWNERLLAHLQLPLQEPGIEISGPRIHTIEMCPALRRYPMEIGKGQITYGYNSFGILPVDPKPGAGLGLGGILLNPKAVLSDQPRPSDIRPIRETEISSPIDMIAIGDALVMYWPATIPRFIGSLDLNPGPAEIILHGRIMGGANNEHDHQLIDRPVALIRSRHAGHWNVVFCDGHVSQMRLADLFDIRLPSSAKRWNRDDLPHWENAHYWISW